MKILKLGTPNFSISISISPLWMLSIGARWKP